LDAKAAPQGVVIASDFAAGIPGAPLPVEKMTSEEFDTVYATNVRGTYFTVQKALPLLGKGASVILTTSIANESAGRM